MSRDDKVIAYLSPADMQALMRETGTISVLETVQSGGQPVIHAALKVVNAESGAELPGGLPFSVVMFKDGREPGYSNIAIGTVVPAAELKIVLPPDFFNLCNRRYRFVRAFPLDGQSFVLQMDLFLHNATREYVKYGFGVWGALFTHVLFELMGNGGQSLAAAAAAYAAMAEDMPARFVETVTEEPVAEVPVEAAAEPAAASVDAPAEPAAEAVAEEADAEVKPEEAKAEVEAVVTDSAEPAAEVAETTAVAEPAAAETVAEKDAPAAPA
jgi:hypothetical protein